MDDLFIEGKQSSHISQYTLEIYYLPSCLSCCLVPTYRPPSFLSFSIFFFIFTIDTFISVHNYGLNTPSSKYTNPQLKV